MAWPDVIKYMKYFTGITDSLESPPGMENRDKKNHLQAIIVNMSKFKWFLSVSYSHQLIVTIDLDAVHTRPEKFTRKTLQKFSKLWKHDKHRSFWICIWGKLEQGNEMIFVTSSFPKSSVFKMPLVPIQMQSQRFHISLVWRVFPKSSREGLVRTVRRS